MDTQAKTEKFIYGHVRSIPKDVHESRTISFVGSDDSIDRMGTVLNQRNWKIENFNANPIIGYQHDVYGGDMCNKPDPDDVIGRGHAYMEETRDADSEPRLLVDITFEPKELNPKAEKVFQKVLHGSLNSVSVGMLPVGKGQFGKRNEAGELENEDVYYFEGQELLEVSVVNIPANANARRRSFRDQSANALSFIQRQLGYSFSDIEDMKVGKIIRELTYGKEEEEEEKDVTRYKQELKKLELRSKL